MCKQTCSEKDVSRLYFQSVGDPNDPTLYQKKQNCEENPEELRVEVKKLEGKVVGLSSVLEKQQKDLKEITVEVCIFVFQYNNYSVQIQEQLCNHLLLCTAEFLQGAA